jgi:hypothetical protein
MQSDSVTFNALSGRLTSAINLMLYSHIIIQTRYLELKIQCLPVPAYNHNAKWTYSIAGRPGGKAPQQTPECQSERDSTEEGLGCP